MRRHDLGSLPEALTWLRDHWDGRSVPLRLHEQGQDGAEGLRFTKAFVRFLMAKASDYTSTSEVDVCYHPTLPRDREDNLLALTRTCPDCSGNGTRVFVRDRYLYPMWAALEALEKVPAMRAGQPTPYQCIAVLVKTDWDVWAAADIAALPMDIAEPLFLMAIRKLYARYRSGPQIGPSWIAKSESQRMAEGAA